jgi:hypothetical protein
MEMISIEDLKRRIKEKFCNSCSTPYKDTDVIEMGEYCCDMVSDTMAFVDELPTIEAEPVKHGRWIDNGICDSMLSACSICGYSCGAYSFNYCPNCGSKNRMDGDGE